MSCRSEGALLSPQTSPPPPPSPRPGPSLSVDKLPRVPGRREGGAEQSDRGTASSRAFRARIGLQEIAQSLLVDVVVGHAQDADGETSEDLGACLVVLTLGRVIVDAAVELEDEALLWAVEVDDEAGDDLLAAELEAAERAVAEALPGGRLGDGRRPSKTPGELELVRVDVRAA